MSNKTISIPTDSNSIYIVGYTFQDQKVTDKHGIKLRQCMVAFDSYTSTPVISTQHPSGWLNSVTSSESSTGGNGTIASCKITLNLNTMRYCDFSNLSVHIMGTQSNCGIIHYQVESMSETSIVLRLFNIETDSKSTSRNGPFKLSLSMLCHETNQ